MSDVFPLHMLSVGQRAQIDQLLGKPDDVQRLEELGLRVGTSVEMLQRGTTCIVKLAGSRLAYREQEGCHVLVRAGEAA